MDFRRRMGFVVASAVWLGAVGPGLAQVPAGAPPVDPGRIDERLREQQAEPSVRALDVPSLPGQQAAPESNVTVQLTDVRFEGVTAVPLAELEALAAPYVGRSMALSEVFVLAEAVTAEYRRRGFVLSRAVVGPQRIEDGILTIQVLEGYVDQISIEGDVGGYRPFLESYMSPVREGRPTSGDALTTALLLARDLQGLDVRAVVTPSATQTGAADLTLVAERDPFEAFLAVDNRGSRWLGPVQVYGGVVLNDLFNTGGRLALTGVVAPDDNELGFVSATYDQPVGPWGTRVSGFASYAKTKPGDELRALGLEGESTTWGLSVQHPLVRSRSANLLTRLTFTARNAESSNDVVSPIFEDQIRTLQAQVFANHADSWGGLTSGQVTVTRGLEAFGASEWGDPNLSRATGRPQFTRVNLELRRIQPIAGGLYVQLAGAAQYSPDSLLASEEFGLGGSQFARAYDPSEVTGDEGVAGRAELFYTLPPQTFGSIEPYAYYEAGRVTQNDPLPGEATRATLESAGVGVRIGINNRFGASFEYAKPLNRDVAAEGDRDGRFFFSLSAAF